MYSTDPIADMLTRIRNALMVRKTSVDVPYSNVKHQIAKILKANNYIDDLKVSGEGKDKKISLELHAALAPARITEITRISKPGRRVYTGSTEIPRVKNGRGIVVMSTSKGLMTGDEAKNNKVGGEVLCSVY